MGDEVGDVVGVMLLLLFTFIFMGMILHLAGTGTQFDRACL